jgi:hypothetical protein
MDALTRIAPAGVELLDRVDTVLAHAGAPAGHPLWPLLRRLRTLPGEAVAAFATAMPAPLVATGDVVRGIAEAYGRDALPSGSEWRGAGAESFALRWRALSEHRDGLADRMRATGAFLGALESWLSESRMLLARTLATVLTSAEAVEVCAVSDSTTASAAVARAAAEIAVPVLESLDIVHERGERLLAEWAPRLDELFYRAPAADGHTDLDATTEVAI